jgi:phosphoribosylanthranilate isomerase
MWIKICANTNLADAQLAADLGADAVGFVFAPSKRRVTALQVAEITENLVGSVDKIGVFGTADPDEIAATVTAAGLTGAQLHSAYDPSLVGALAVQFGSSLKLIQTVAYEIDGADHEADHGAADRNFEATLTSAFAEPALWAVLVDAARAGASGGLGVAFDWAHAAAIVDRVRAIVRGGQAAPRLILAGGLRDGNVAAAIAALRPRGVDVASGVEAAPGIKDPERLRRFMAAAR